MFGLLADLIASIATILLPSYLAFKSLRTRDPAQYAPWLIYFCVLSLTLLFESWTLFIIGWIPFYSWLRLFFLLYLVLPQTQGAKVLYIDYLEPYIVQHENNIDRFIGETHEKLQQMGLGYLNVVIEYLREKVLGQASPQPQQPQAANYASYASDLISRFAMPAARSDTPFSSAGTTGGGIYNTISGFAGSALSSTSASTTSPPRPRDYSAATYEAAQVPRSLLSQAPTSAAEKATFISFQRDRLTDLLKALDSEQQSLDLAYGSAAGLKAKSRSEQSFEKVDHDDIHTPPSSSSHDSTPSKIHPSAGSRRTTSGSWMPSSVGGWFGSAAAGTGAGDGDSTTDKASKGWNAARDITEELAKGMSSGVDTGR